MYRIDRQTERRKDRRGETDGDRATYRQTRSSLVDITERIASTTVSATSVCFIVSLSLFVALFCCAYFVQSIFRLVYFEYHF